MKLVLIGPVYPYRGGIAHYTLMLMRTLLGRGHQVLMVSFKRQYPDRLFPGESDREPGEVPLDTGDTKYWIDSLNPFTWLSTFRRIRQYRPDAIVLPWWTSFWAPTWTVFGLLNQLFLKRPMVFLCHNVLPHEASRWDPVLARAALRWGAGFIVQSDDERQKLLSLLPGAQAVVCPLPVLDLFRRQKLPRDVARRVLRLREDELVVLFFGIVRDYKGLEDLLRAMPEVRQRMGQVRLLVAGEFWEDEGPYREMVQELGIEELVHIDSRYIPNEELGVYFSAADVLVAPYRRVTGSAVLQMARGFGLPAISTEIGGIREALGDEAFLLVPPSDPQALAGAIVSFFEEGPDLATGYRHDGQNEMDSGVQLAEAIEELVGEAGA